MEAEIWCVLTTVENPEQARKLATEAVEGGLAACVQIDECITSIYRWQGKLETGTESRLLIKLPSGKKENLIKWLRTHHPYDVPEILAWPVPEVDRAYADWVRQS